jgi:hypothetical protein
MRVPYAIVALEVEKLYSQKFDDSQVEAIEKHCEYIADFIKACSWTEDEYWDQWYREQDKELS